MYEKYDNEESVETTPGAVLGCLAFVIVAVVLGLIFGPSLPFLSNDAKDKITDARGVVNTSFAELLQEAGETEVGEVKVPAGVRASEPGKMQRCRISNAEHRKGCQLAKSYAATLYSGSQLSCLDMLWISESGWNPWAYNSQATTNGNAYGIPQALNRLHKYPYKFGDWKAQVDWGVAYIKRRYGTPCAAWSFWQRQTPHHWY